jgi:hypothetical protein
MTTTDTEGLIEANGRVYHLFQNGSTDGTETEIKVLTPAGASVSVGVHLKGQTITRLALQCSDGSILSTVILYGADAGVKLSAVGCERTSNQLYNIDLKDLRVPVTDGDLLKTNCAD